MQNTVRKIAWVIMTLLSLAVAVYGVLFLLLPGLAEGNIKERFLSIFPLAGWSHILGGSVALVTGPFQFLPRIREKYLKVHRKIGIIYLTGVVIGGIAGLFLGIYSEGGTIAHLGFMSLAVLWLFSGYKAYTAIKRSDENAHQSWMIRNYALTYAAVTLRIYIPVFLAGAGMTFEASYKIISWLCWVPNLILAESIFVRKINTG